MNKKLAFSEYKPLASLMIIQVGTLWEETTQTNSWFKWSSALL